MIKMSKEFESKMNGKLFNFLEPTFRDEFNALRQQGLGICFQFEDMATTDMVAANKLLGELITMKGNNFVEPPFACELGRVELGENTFLKFHSTFQDIGKVTLGKNCIVGPNCSFYTAAFPLDPSARNAGMRSAKDINIGDNVFIGGSVVVQPGVTIGDNTVIGTGSVVVKDIPAGVFAAGNPCKVIREIDMIIAEAQFQPDAQVDCNVLGKSEL